MKKRHQSKEVQALEARISTLENVVQHMDNYLRQLDAYMHMTVSSPQVDQGTPLDTSRSGFSSAESQPQPEGLGRSALDVPLAMPPDEGSELDTLTLHGDGIQQDYQRRVDAWRQREQTTQAHHEGGR